MPLNIFLSTSNATNNSTDNFFVQPPPFDTPFSGPTLSLFDLFDSLLPTLNITRIIELVKQFLDHSNNEQQLTPQIDKSWFITPQNFSQTFLAYPLTFEESDEPSFLTLQSLLDHINREHELTAEQLEDFLNTENGKALTEDQQTDLFWFLITKNFPNLDKLLMAMFSNLQNIRVNDLNPYTNVTAVQHFSTHKKIAVLRILLQQAATDPNLKQEDSGATALHMAADAGHLREVEELLDSKLIDLNAARDCDGFTPLHCAVRNGNVRLVQALIARKDLLLNRQNNSGETALHLALKHRTAVALPLIKLLLSREDLNPNLTDTKGQTPLHCMLNAFNEDIQSLIEALFESSTLDINLQNAEGDTALHLVVKNNWLALSHLLKHSDINFYVENNQGQIPVESIETGLSLIKPLTIDEYTAPFILSMQKSKIENPLQAVRGIFMLPRINSFDELIGKVILPIVLKTSSVLKTIIGRQRTHGQRKS